MPRRYAELFRGQESLLASHRGWDPGALELARRFQRSLRAPLISSTTTRLLIELNRSLRHRRLFSDVVAALSADERKKLIDEVHAPHWNAVAAAVDEALASPASVLHLGVHTFTPQLDGVVRTADVALLYDPRREQERAFCGLWLAELARARPELRLRRNYPYRGIDDGLTTALRRRYPPEDYLGVELEVNQAFPLGDATPWRRLQRDLAAALSLALQAFAA